MAASPSVGVNTVTGEGLAEALKGAEIVVDVANSPSFEDKEAMEFFKTSGHNLTLAEAKAGIKHHIVLSVVGTDRLNSGYFRAKLAQEKIIKESGIPYTILRATQFFEFIGAIAQSGKIDEDIYISPAFIQPIASEDVVAGLIDIITGPPLNNTLEIAGPEKLRLDELVRKYMHLKQDPHRGLQINTHLILVLNLMMNRLLLENIHV